MRRLALITALIAAGCADDGVTLPDAAVASPPDAAPVTTPAAPAPPALTPCPAGWREVPPLPGDGAATCEPFPEDGPAACPAGEAHFPGEPGCAPVGAACPAGDWPDALPAGRPVRHARAGAPPGGDGSAAAPFASLSAALSGALAGTVVAATGDFVEAVSLPSGMAIIGACAARTSITAAAPSESAAVVNVAGAGGELRNLRLGGERPGIWVNAGRSVALDGVIVEGTRGAALLVLGGTVTGQALVVRDTRERASDGTFGHAIHVEVGGQVDVERLIVERSRAGALVAVDEGTALRVADVVVRDTLTELPSAMGGQAVYVDTGARVVVERALLEGSRASAVLARWAGTTVDLTDVILRDTLPAETDGRFGVGIIVQYTAEVTGRRLLSGASRSRAAPRPPSSPPTPAPGSSSRTRPSTTPPAASTTARTAAPWRRCAAA